MKRGTAKAVKLGMKMLKWLEENDDRKNTWLDHTLQVRTGKDTHVIVTGQLRSHRTVNRFKKAFQELSALKRGNYSGTLKYEGNTFMLSIPLEVSITGISVLPKTCRVEVKEVWHDKTVYEGGYRIEKRVICDSNRKS